MSGKPRKEKVIVELNKIHKIIMDKFIPWFGNTTGEVLMNLSLRWIESNVANTNLIGLADTGAMNIETNREIFPDPTIYRYKGFRDFSSDIKPADRPTDKTIRIRTVTPQKRKVPRLGYTPEPGKKKATPIGAEPKDEVAKRKRKGKKQNSKSGYGS